MYGHHDSCCNGTYRSSEITFVNSLQWYIPSHRVVPVAYFGNCLIEVRIHTRPGPVGDYKSRSLACKALTYLPLLNSRFKKNTPLCLILNKLVKYARRNSKFNGKDLFSIFIPYEISSFPLSLSCIIFLYLLSQSFHILVISVCKNRTCCHSATLLITFISLVWRQCFPRGHLKYLFCARKQSS